MLQETSLDHRVDPAEASHFRGAFREARLEFVDDTRVGGLGQNQLLSLEVLQVLDRLLQDVRLLKL